jgi:hypothetical protein
MHSPVDPEIPVGRSFSLTNSGNDDGCAHGDNGNGGTNVADAPTPTIPSSPLAPASFLPFRVTAVFGWSSDSLPRYRSPPGLPLLTVAFAQDAAFLPFQTAVLIAGHIPSLSSPLMSCVSCLPFSRGDGRFAKDSGHARKNARQSSNPHSIEAASKSRIPLPVRGPRPPRCPGGTERILTLAYRQVIGKVNPVTPACGCAKSAARETEW